MTVGCQAATPQYLSQTCDFDKKRIVITVIKGTKRMLKAMMMVLVAFVHFVRCVVLKLN